MSKRQALGAITINSNGVGAVMATATTTASSAAAAAVAVSAKSNVMTLKHSQQLPLQSKSYNNENMPPPMQAHMGKSAKQQQQNEFDFEIFQEDNENAPHRTTSQLDTHVVTACAAATNNQAPRLREAKHVNFYLNRNNEDEEQCEEKRVKKYDQADDEEEEDGEDEEEGELENVAPQEDEDDDDDEDDDSPDSGATGLEDEEGFSRLNIAAMIDSTSRCATTTTSTSEQDASHCELMMDSSSSTQNDDDYDSTMMLDDTIRCVSMKSAASSSLYTEEEVDEDDEQNEHEEDDEHPQHDIRASCSAGGRLDVEDDEQTRRTERDNVIMNFAEYKDEILAYMRQLEQEHRPKPAYMKRQIDINANMRSILVDWLVEVCEEYKLNLETLYLAVNYTDRFLSQMSVLRGKLQLVGTASMYVAAKYEEIVPPDICEFVYITDDTYTRKQVLRMEHLLLKVLDFKMSMPTANWFLSYYLRFIRQNTSLNNANNVELAQRIEHLARYLCELTLIDSETYLSYLPSQIAASSVYLAMHTLGRAWTKQTAEICGYSHDLVELKPCIQALWRTMQAAPEHPQQAIQEKYKKKTYDYVALVEPPKSLPTHLAS